MIVGKSVVCKGNTPTLSKSLFIERAYFARPVNLPTHYPYSVTTSVVTTCTVLALSSPSHSVHQTVRLHPTALTSCRVSKAPCDSQLTALSSTSPTSEECDSPQMAGEVEHVLLYREANRAGL